LLDEKKLACPSGETIRSGRGDYQTRARRLSDPGGETGSVRKIAPDRLLTEKYWDGCPEDLHQGLGRYISRPMSLRMRGYLCGMKKKSEKLGA